MYLDSLGATLSDWITLRLIEVDEIHNAKEMLIRILKMSMHTKWMNLTNKFDMLLKTWLENCNWLIWLLTSALIIIDISNPRIIGIAILSTSEMSESSSEEVVECEANAND